MLIYRASVDSRHFSFEAYGVTRDEARFTLTCALERHAEATGATEEWVDMASGDINVQQHETNKAYRDGTEI